MSSAISSLSSYDNSNEVDSKIITALLDFSNRGETDQEIANALGSVDLSSYYTSAQTDSLFYPRTELDSLLTATLTQYWTSGRTQSEIDDALAGSDFLDQAGPGRPAPAPRRQRLHSSDCTLQITEGGGFFSLVQIQFTPVVATCSARPLFQPSPSWAMFDPGLLVQGARARSRPLKAA